jgi:hypothetical protein
VTIYEEQENKSQGNTKTILQKIQTSVNLGVLVAVDPNNYIIGFSSFPGFQIYFFLFFLSKSGQDMNYFVFSRYFSLTGIGREMCDAGMPCVRTRHLIVLHGRDCLIWKVGF